MAITTEIQTLVREIMFLLPCYLELKLAQLYDFLNETWKAIKNNSRPIVKEAYGISEIINEHIATRPKPNDNEENPRRINEEDTNDESNKQLRQKIIQRVNELTDSSLKGMPFTDGPKLGQVS